MSLDDQADGQAPRNSHACTEATAAARPEEVAVERIRANVLQAQAEIQTLQLETKRLAAERDAWMQELFEVNRYNAHLVQARQALAESEASLRARVDFLQQELEENPRPTRQVHKPSAGTQHEVEEIARLRTQVHELRTSTSWRVSAPVRLVGRLLGRG